jgi:hypothetical protein
MKSSRLDKLEAQLSVAETSLLNLLAQVLPGVALSGEMLFFNSAFLPDTIQPHWLPQESEELLSLANNAVLLREELGLSVVGTVGQLYLSACSESANYTNGNRRGPRRLATWLLGELGSNISFEADGFAAAQLQR